MRRRFSRSCAACGRPLRIGLAAPARSDGARRPLLSVEDVVQDVNRFLRGWAGYFRYGNSADAFDEVTSTRSYAWLASSPSVTTAAAGTAGGPLSTSHRTDWS